MIKHITTLLSIVILFSGILYSCRKDNINGDKNDLVLGSYLTLKKTINTNLDFSKPTATVSITVGSYGKPVKSINIYLATGDALDIKTWKLIKTVPFGGDSATLVVTTAEIAAALAPATIEPGNQYVLQNEAVTSDGKKFSADNTPTNYTSFPTYNMALSWNATAVCPFNQTASAGAYAVTYDGDWVDYHTGDPITVSAGPGPNQINFPMYPSIVIGGGVQQVNTVVDVDPVSGAATIKSQKTGYYGSATPGNLVTMSGTGFVFSCTGVVDLVVTANVGGTDYAGLHFTMKKQ